MGQQRSYWITVRHDAERTQDFRIAAPSAYSAGWLYRQLHPTAKIISIREVPSC